MPRDAEAPLRVLCDPTILLAAVACAACAVVWTLIALRWLHRRPLLPFQRRRAVPWRGIDVAITVLAYYCLMPALLVCVSKVGLGLPNSVLSDAAHSSPVEKGHAIQQVLSQKSGSPWPMLLGAISAIVVAPITEELIFRLILQGWLESVERRMRRQMRWLRRIVVGLLPVTIVAVLFAAIHFRTPEQRRDPSTLVVQLQLFVVHCVIVVVLSVAWLKYAAKATWADLGIVPAKLAEDVKLGLLAFVAVTPPVYAVMFAAGKLLPENSVPDPIPLLFLGLALGVLYYHTHRIVPSIVLHSAFNAVAVATVLTAT
jgi:membrane protease YdiL (CAAX protease family)